jgi:small subunit ribosomal protein S20
LFSASSYSQIRFKEIFKTFEKKFRAAVAEGNKEAAAEFLKITRSKLDKAAKVGTLHPNKVSNKKSQLDKLMNTMA